MRVLTTPDEFVERTKEALCVIKERDPIRYARIKRYIKFITNEEWIAQGEYRHHERSIRVDFGSYKFSENHYWYLYRYACLIVHESTHGRIAAFGIPYTWENWRRIEKACHNEERRFLQRAWPEALPTMVGEFNESGWTEYFSKSRWEKVKELWNLVKQREKKVDKRK